MTASPARLYTVHRKLALEVPEEEHVAALVALWNASRDWDGHGSFAAFARSRIRETVGDGQPQSARPPSTQPSTPD